MTTPEQTNSAAVGQSDSNALLGTCLSLFPFAPPSRVIYTEECALAEWQIDEKYFEMCVDNYAGVQEVEIMIRDAHGKFTHWKLVPNG